MIPGKSNVEVFLVWMHKKPTTLVDNLRVIVRDIL